MRAFNLIVVVLSLAGCAAPAHRADSTCASGGLMLDAHFEAGKLGQCQVIEGGMFLLTHYPEDPPPINVSPWYAFRLSGQVGQEAKLRLVFEHGFARYWPKISRDGQSWESLPTGQVLKSADGKSMDISLRLDQAEVWIAGQKILDTTWYDDWLRELAGFDHVTTRLAGSSVKGRPIFLAETADRPELILLLGRQHPPEVTGASTMKSFVATLLADTELARSFRQRFKLLIFPLLNPDGVAQGHWRHNTQGVDLNRDWGPFTQPETRIVRDWLDASEAQRPELRLMLDFHSTYKNVFYTQRDEDKTVPELFAKRWLNAFSQRMPDYEFVRESSDGFEQPNSKNYFYTQYGIPAITYETGDDTPAIASAEAAVVFAEEMMRLMLSYPSRQP